MNKRRIAGDVAFGVLLLWTVAGTVLVVRASASQRRPQTPRPPANSWTAVPNWHSLTERGYRLGDSASQSTVIVFSDFQCPYCRVFSSVVDSLHNKYPNVQIVERHFPLVGLHDEAFSAALAAECSRDFGRYGEMRHALFAKRGLVEDEEWGSLASKAGISDTAAVVRCVAEKSRAREVNADIAAGERVGVQGTPGVLVDGFLHQGATSLVDLEQRLELQGAGQK